MKVSTKLKMLALATIGSTLVTTTTQALDLTASSDNPVVFFDDTSESGAEWFIGSTMTGGFDQFVLRDFVSSANVFRVQPGSGIESNDDSLVFEANGDMRFADNTVFLERASGRIGIGTTSPEDSLHVKGGSGNLIIEGDGYSKWELATLGGGGFWLNDKLSDTKPFSIEGNAPTDSIYISTTGVGIGTAIPAAKLAVTGDIKSTFIGSSTKSLQQLFVMSANNTDSGKRSDAGFVVENARENFSYAFRTLEKFTRPGEAFEIDGGFAISKQATGAQELVLINPTTNDPSKVELHLSSGASNVDGQWENASSRSYKKNINELSGADAMQAMRGLKSVSYQFKKDKGDNKMIGFIAEDIPELLATKTRKTVDTLRIVAVLTKAMQEQDKSLVSKDQKIAEMQHKIDKLEKLETRFGEMEAMMQKLSSSFKSQPDNFASINYNNLK